MNSVSAFFAEKHWLVQCLFLLIFMIVGGLVFSAVGQLVAYVFCHTMNMYDASNPASFIRITQSFGTLGCFLLPALLFARLQDGKWLNFSSANRLPNYIMVDVVLVLSIVLLPIVSLLEQWNGSMELPDSLTGVQQWMETMEENATSVLRLLTADHTVLSLVMNLIVMALLAALCEEFFFRGTIQTALLKWTGKPHLAIWITAFLFSVIHLQFAGFIPRLLLGAYLGYLLYWSRSLWLPIMAHFLHNALSIIITYVFEGRGIMIDEMKFTDIRGATTLSVSCIIVATMGIVFLWKTHKELDNA